MGKSISSNFAFCVRPVLKLSSEYFTVFYITLENKTTPPIEKGICKDDYEAT